jgi:hypothetical protein
MITIEWVDGFPCIKLPNEVVLTPDVKVIKPVKKPERPKHRKDFSKLQQIKEDKCFKDLLKELKERFKDKKE